MNNNADISVTLPKSQTTKRKTRPFQAETKLLSDYLRQVEIWFGRANLWQMSCPRDKQISLSLQMKTGRSLCQDICQDINLSIKKKYRFLLYKRRLNSPTNFDVLKPCFVSVCNTHLFVAVQGLVNHKIFVAPCICFTHWIQYSS